MRADGAACYQQFFWWSGQSNLRAIEAAPRQTQDSLRNFAVFLSEKLKDHARADN